MCRGCLLRDFRNEGRGGKHNGHRTHASDECSLDEHSRAHLPLPRDAPPSIRHFALPASGEDGCDNRELRLGDEVDRYRSPVRYVRPHYRAVPHAVVPARPATHLEYVRRLPHGRRVENSCAVAALDDYGLRVGADPYCATSDAGARVVNRVHYAGRCRRGAQEAPKRLQRFDRHKRDSREETLGSDVRSHALSRTCDSRHVRRAGMLSGGTA
mmetsp:Transcript_9876/g.24415  ORF Transcript_9876/g.24415 Transcript_9876/m.24415 type:complete len:213 (-) Transcript_9876:538-1176(-)